MIYIIAESEIQPKVATLLVIFLERAGNGIEYYVVRRMDHELGIVHWAPTEDHHFVSYEEIVSLLVNFGYTLLEGHSSITEISWRERMNSRHPGMFKTKEP